MKDIVFMPITYKFKYKSTDYEIAFSKYIIEHTLSVLCNYKFTMTTSINNIAEYKMVRSSQQYNVDHIVKTLGVDFMFIYGENCYGKLTLYVVPIFSGYMIRRNIYSIYTTTLSSYALSYAYVFSDYMTEQEYIDNVIQPIFGGTLTIDYSYNKSTTINIPNVKYEVTPKGINYINKQYNNILSPVTDIEAPFIIYDKQNENSDYIYRCLIHNNKEKGTSLLKLNILVNNNMFIPVIIKVKMDVPVYKYIDSFYLLYQSSIETEPILENDTNRKECIDMIKRYMKGIVNDYDISYRNEDGLSHVVVSNIYKCKTCNSDVNIPHASKVNNRKCAYCGKEQCYNCYTDSTGYKIYNGALICNSCIDTMGVSANANI